MHHIQRKILYKLMHAPSLGYAQMRPAGVESNHFAYHLDQLVQDGLVAKQGRTYMLTAKGLALADRTSHETMTVRQQPHIVTAIDVTNGAGQMLLFRHAFQPYLNLYGFVQGRTHYEEQVAEAAARELAEKTGLHDIPLKHRGVVYIHATRGGEEISKILAHVFSGRVEGTPPLSTESDKGTCLWDEATKYSKEQCMPGFWEVKRLLEKPAFFFMEIETEMA